MTHTNNTAKEYGIHEVAVMTAREYVTEKTGAEPTLVSPEILSYMDEEYKQHVVTTVAILCGHLMSQPEGALANIIGYLPEMFMNICGDDMLIITGIDVAMSDPKDVSTFIHEVRDHAHALGELSGDAFLERARKAGAAYHEWLVSRDRPAYANQEQWEAVLKHVCGMSVAGTKSKEEDKAA